MLKIAVLYGGKSGEHEVSLVSAASILKHLDRSRYEVIPIGITKDGRWLLQNDIALAPRVPVPAPAPASAPAPVPADAAASDMTPLPPIRRGDRIFVAPGSGLVREGPDGTVSPLPCDVVFPVLHGSFGEDGTIQGLLETAGLPYVGGGVLASAIGMDKEIAKELWMHAGLPVVDFIAVHPGDLAGDRFPALRRKVEARFGWPVFVKPACAGSSVGASKVSGPENLENALKSALEWDSKALVEPFVEAHEIECAVLGNAEPVAFPPGEVASTHEFYDYDAKYQDPDGARLLVPAPLSPMQATRVREIALAAYRVCEMSGMARIDFFVDKKTGEVLLNEANTIPGFTGISMYPRMCASGGLPYPELLDRLIALALERHAERSAIRYDFA